MTKPVGPVGGADELIRDIQRATQLNRSPDDKIGNVFAGVGNKERIAELRRWEGIHLNL